MTYFEKRVQQLIAFDSIRIGKIIEIFQFSLIFTFLAIFAAYYSNKYLLLTFNDNDSFFKILFLLSIELSILTIIIFYLRKITLLFPSVASILFTKFNPYTTIDIGMWMVLVFVFIGNIDKLNDKIGLLKTKIDSYMQ